VIKALIPPPLRPLPLGKVQYKRRNKRRRKKNTEKGEKTK